VVAWGIGPWDPEWAGVAGAVFAGLRLYWCSLDAAEEQKLEWALPESLAGFAQASRATLASSLRHAGWPCPELVRLALGSEAQAVVAELRPWLETARALVATGWSGPGAGQSGSEPALWELAHWLGQAGFVLAALSVQAGAAKSGPVRVDACFLAERWYWELARRPGAAGGQLVQLGAPGELHPAEEDE